MLAGLLDTARLETGSMTPSMTTVPLANIFSRIQVDFLPVAEHRGLKLTVRPSTWWVSSDAVFLERIVRNLVGNAIAYTASGGVVLGARRRNGRIAIEVWDSGSGITAPIRRKFSRLTFARKTVGVPMPTAWGWTCRLRKIWPLRSTPPLRCTRGWGEGHAFRSYLTRPMMQRRHQSCARQCGP